MFFPIWVQCCCETNRTLNLVLFCLELIMMFMFASKMYLLYVCFSLCILLLGKESRWNEEIHISWGKHYHQLGAILFPMLYWGSLGERQKFAKSPHRVVFGKEICFLFIQFISAAEEVFCGVSLPASVLNPADSGKYWLRKCSAPIGVLKSF